MKTRVIAALIGGSVGALLWSGFASAAPTGDRPPYGPPPTAAGPVDGVCPNGWSTRTGLTEGHLSTAYDFNNDDTVCYRVVAGAFTFMDNVIPQK